MLSQYHNQSAKLSFFQIVFLAEFLKFVAHFHFSVKQIAAF